MIQESASHHGAKQSLNRKPSAATDVLGDHFSKSMAQRTLRTFFGDVPLIAIDREPDIAAVHFCSFAHAKPQLNPLTSWVSTSPKRDFCQKMSFL